MHPSHQICWQHSTCFPTTNPYLSHFAMPSTCKHHEQGGLSCISRWYDDKHLFFISQTAYSLMNYLMHQGTCNNMQMLVHPMMKETITKVNCRSYFKTNMEHCYGQRTEPCCPMIQRKGGKYTAGTNTTNLWAAWKRSMEFPMTNLLYMHASWWINNPKKQVQTMCA